MTPTTAKPTNVLVGFAKRTNCILKDMCWVFRGSAEAAPGREQRIQKNKKSRKTETFKVLSNKAKPLVFHKFFAFSIAVNDFSHIDAFVARFVPKSTVPSSVDIATNEQDITHSIVNL